MIAILSAVLFILSSLAMTVLADMVSEEVRDRLDHLPRAILRLAGRQVDPTKREAIYDDEWLPELAYILTGDETRPVTRLFVGTRYALGVLINARRIARHLSRPAPGQSAGTPDEESRKPSRSAPALAARFLVALTGARSDVLARCPGEEKKFLVLGIVLVITSALGSATVWLALTVVGCGPVLASLAAPLWGIINLVLDRWLAISMKGHFSRNLLIAAPRFFLAVTLSAIISCASVLTFFPSRVSSQAIQIVMLDPPNRPALLSALNQSGKPEMQLQQTERLHLAGVTQVLVVTLGEPGQTSVQSKEVTSLTDGGSYGNQEIFSGSDTGSPTVYVSHSRNGPLLLRLQALDQLVAANTPIGAVLVLAALLAMVIGCLPLAVRLAQRPGLYKEFTP